MSSDSDIAKHFSCGKTKCAYLISFGIAPCFKEMLSNVLNGVTHYVALFDESYNKVTKNGQMDIHIRFWDPTENIVKTRYWTSEFLGKASANDLSEKFCNGIAKLDQSKLIQISSDGPNVNLAFLKIIKEKRIEEELPHLITIGTCGLHTLHGSFKCG